MRVTFNGMQTRQWGRSRQAVLRVTKEGIVVTLLLVAIVTSAFGLLYTKDLNRRTFMAYQGALSERNQLSLTWSQLALEESAWSSQARIEGIATQSLGMRQPASVVMLEATK